MTRRALAIAGCTAVCAIAVLSSGCKTESHMSKAEEDNFKGGPMPAGFKPNVGGPAPAGAPAPGSPPAAAPASAAPAAPAAPK